MDPIILASYGMLAAAPAPKTPPDGAPAPAAPDPRPAPTVNKPPKPGARARTF